MKIVFILPEQTNVYGLKTTKPRFPHLGIAYLNTYLKKQGHDVTVFDCSIERKHDLLFDKLLCTHDVVGVSLYSLNIGASYNFVNKIVSYLKKTTQKYIPVVLGGPHVTIVKKETLIKTEADFAIQGEGELTLSELLNNLQNRDSFFRINGLMWRDREGVIIENPARDFISDIDSLAFPDYSVFKLDKYINYELNEMPIMTSRGCPFHCSFCAIASISGKRFRARSPDNVFSEIMAHYNLGIRSFFIVDDVFNLNMERAEKICDLIINNRLNIKLIFYNGLRVDYLNESLVKKLKRAGCATVVLSAESGNNDVLKAIGKHTTVEKIIHAVEIVNSADITFTVNFIIGHPTETYNKAMDSIRLAKKLSKKKNCAAIMFFTLIPYPSTVVFEWIEKNGRWLLPKDKYLDILTMTDITPIFETMDFTKIEREVLLRKGNNIHRATVFNFIYGKYVGFLIYLITSFGFIRYLAIKIAFSNKVSRGTLHMAFLRKLYGIK